MPNHRRLSLAPAGLRVLRVEAGPDRIIITTSPISSDARCPSCGGRSRSFHSRYHRRLSDLPWQGRTAQIVVSVRRMRCRSADCSRRIFAETVGGAAERHARRTVRLAEIHRHIGLGMGGEAGARLAERLAMPVSAATLLRTVRRSASPSSASLVTVLGVDDWAWRKGCRYGTILCDLEQRRVIDLLPDRTAETFAAWLRDHPTVKIVSRDRGGSYADGVRRAGSSAVQVADRWHLMANCSARVLEVVKRHLAAARKAIADEPAKTPTAGDMAERPMTCAELQSLVVWRRKMDRHRQILRLQEEGMPIKQITRQTGFARETVRRTVRGIAPSMRPPRISSLDPHRAFLEGRWREGCRNGAKLWRELRARGFAGSMRVVSEWRTRQRLADRHHAPRQHIANLSARQVVWLITSEFDALTFEQRSMRDRIFAAVKPLASVGALAVRFFALIREKNDGALNAWIDDAAATDLRSLAAGLKSDIEAVRAALIYEWSNGQVEGRITKLKLIKRAMYGRAKLDLLRARLMAA